MNTPEQTETAAPSPSEQRQPVKKRHGLLLAGVITTVVLAVLVLILQAVPELVVRYVIERELERMGIASEGVVSLHIDLWRRKAFLGHMRFGGGPENQGQIGRVSVKYRLINLLSEQAVIEEMIIDGVDIQITRATDGEIVVNGIDVSKLMAADEKAETAPVDEGGWGAGLDKFELRNSRIFFDDRSRGTLDLDVERLSLAGFRTWEPDDPGTFELIGTFNEMPFKWKGEARPFAEKLTLSVEGSIDEADFTKIQKLTGPLGFTEQSGSLSTNFKHDVTLFPTGRIEIASRGEILERDINSILTEGVENRFEEGITNLQTQLVLDEDGNTGLKGTVRVVWKRGGLEVGGTDLEFDDISLNLENLDLFYSAVGLLNVTATLRLAIQAPKLSGAANGQGDRIGIDLSELKVEQADGSLAVSTAGTTTLDAFKLSLPQAAAEGAPAQKPLDVAFAKATFDVAKLLFSSAGETIRLEAQPQLSVVALNFDGLAKGGVQSINLDFSALTVEQTGADLSLTGAGTTVLDALNLALSETKEGDGSATTKPISLDFTQARLDLARLLLAMKDGSLRVEAQPKLSVDAPSFGGPAQVSTETLKVDLSDLKVEQGGVDLSVTAAGMTALGASKLSMPKSDGAESAEPLNLAFSQATLDFARMLLALKDSGLRLETEPRLTVDALDLGGPAQATMERLDVALKTLDLTSEDKNISVTASGAADLSVLQALVAGETALFPMKLDLGHFNVDLKEGGWGTIGTESRWNARLDTKLEGFAASLAEGSVGQAKLRELVLEGGSADQTMNFAAAALVIGGLDLEFNEKLYSTPETGADTKAKEGREDQPGTPSSRPVIKLAKISFSDPAKIRFRDTSVSPNVAVDVDIEKLEIDKLDTGDPSQKTDLQLAATVNGFTKLQLSGWSQAFATEPSFDLKGQVKNVQLASFSSYAAKAIGLNLESGVLDADAGGNANDGKLDGDVKLDLLDLDFSPLSKADAERLSSQVGAPIETVVGLLEDSDGRIKLNLPVSGTVAEPDIDVSQAIGQAIAGALKSIFPPTAIASMLSSGFKGAGVNFKDIPFAVGDASLTPEGEEIAASIVQMLKQRPKLRLRVCGRATSADFDAYMAEAFGSAPAPTAAAQATPSGSPQAGAPAEPPPASGQQLLEKARSKLTNLATERGRAVRRYVVDSQGISANSLGECLPKFDSTDQDPPRAKLKL